MKKVGKIIVFVGGLLEALFGVLWLIAILISLFRGDPGIYAQPFYGYLDLSLRIVRCLFYISLGVLAALLLGKKEHPVLRLYVFVLGSVAFMMDTAFSGLAVTKGDVSFLGQFVPLLLSVLYFVGALLYYLATKPSTVLPVSSDEQSQNKPLPSEEKSPSIEGTPLLNHPAENLTERSSKRRGSSKTKSSKKE